MNTLTLWAGIKFLSAIAAIAAGFVALRLALSYFAMRAPITAFWVGIVTIFLMVAYFLGYILEL